MAEVISNLRWHNNTISRDDRRRCLGHFGMTVWFTGLSGSGKSTIASAVEAELVRAGRPAYLLDGDNLRHGLTAGLGFTPEDRIENVRRIAEVAALMADAGIVSLVSVISPYQAQRAVARSVHAERGLPFLEAWVATPLTECERRDPKGLYSRARAGELTGFTGIDAPYESPTHPDLVLGRDGGVLDAAVGLVLNAIEHHDV